MSIFVSYRLKFFKISIVFLSLFFQSVAFSQTITLNKDTPLRSQPNNESTDALAKKGEDIIIISNTDDWVIIKYKGKKYYTEFDNIYKVYSGPSDYPVSASTDPTCDYTHPYSGSNIYFDRPLAKMRHSGPLGFLFGWHGRAPC